MSLYHIVCKHYKEFKKHVLEIHEDNSKVVRIKVQTKIIPFTGHYTQNNL